MNVNPTDLLALAPHAETVKVVTTEMVETAQTFLNAICLPAAQETGLWLRDKVRVWRAHNLANIANKAKDLISITSEGVQLKATPRIVHEVVENSSWCEDEQLQQMWAGLLASACTPDGMDESNLLFIDILKRITSAEAKLIEYGCQYTQKLIVNGQFSVAQSVVPMNEILKLTGWTTEPIARAHLGHLFSLGLLRNRHATERDSFYEMWGIDVGPSEFGLQFYVRCCGSTKSPQEFFQTMPTPKVRVEMNS